jgi:uncharacterized SAM-binding protein YcdF (DUF218 family)
MRRRIGFVMALAVITGGVVTGGPSLGPLLAVERPLAAPDAIVVLGSHEWERLPAAAFHARAFPGAVVVLTQPIAPTQYNCYDCATRVETLGDLGVAPARVRILPRPVGTTWDEAQALREAVAQHGWRRVLIVTTSYHARRALATVSSVLAELPVDVGVVTAGPWSTLDPAGWWRRTDDRSYVCYEWLALAKYAVVHGVSPRIPPAGATRAGAD